MALFFKKKTDFACPISGKMVSLSQVNDPVFSTKTMGDGFAIIPDSGKLVAPFDCDVMVAFPTGHAFGLQSKNYEVLIHIGLDTVMLNGEGFDVKVKAGDHLKKGDVLVEVDMDYIRSQGKDTITPVIFTSKETVNLLKENQTVAVLEEDIIQVK